MSKMNFLKLAKEAAAIATDKKGEDIVLLNVKRLTVVAEYFLIVTVESAPQMAAVADAIVTAFKERHGLAPHHYEGRDTATWAVIDFGGLVVHVMMPSARALYSLEKIWSEARRIKTS